VHTIKLKIQDDIYDHVMFLLNNISQKEVEIISDDSDVSMTDTKARIKKLFTNKKINIFESIKDPVAWQKDLRDEW
jgi:hypothetical protein